MQLIPQCGDRDAKGASGQRLEKMESGVDIVKLKLLHRLMGYNISVLQPVYSW